LLVTLVIIFSRFGIVEVKKESHSAKNSGTRPLFLEMLYELNQDKYDGILTWAPDRLSRNAGDLGSLVDLMDRGKLVHIKTNSQSFSNNPNEKFLLMILCSQAKLENDNRGLNVKRGIRAKCEMGWRPSPAPIGYLNYSHLGTKKVMLDKETAPLIKEMFTMVANGCSGRDVKDWVDKDERLKKQTQRNIPLSMVYRMLKNTFYYGEFEYPVGGGKWYKGSHDPIISKELFREVQKKLSLYNQTKPKVKWGSKTFALKDSFKCAYCGASVIGEEKYKLLKSGKKNRHVYYHCSKKVDPNCPEPYVNEIDLIDKLLSFIELVEKRKHTLVVIPKETKIKIQKYNAFKNQVLQQQNILAEVDPIKFSEYFKQIILNGNDEEKQEVLKCIQQPLYLHNGDIFVNPLI
jgi:site-specific DNA recombinase